MNPTEPIWSVSAVNKAVKDTLEGAFMPFWMGGEVGSLLLHRSGHAYFQMKDDRCQIKVCWFGGAAQCNSLGVGNGTLVEVWGNLSVYDVRGEYQFNVKKLRLAGIGSLQRRFEELKNKLEAEGLFDPARKKPVPLFPRQIGVISSPSGAAVRDFLQILNRRFPDVTVKIFPAQVQGAGAAQELADGIKFFNRPGQADVIVITRGGGSMEDLWCFNEEILVRTVAASKIPVISAVGHEIDFTLCDFAADLRVPTPSAAAELVIGRYDEINNRLNRAKKDMSNLLLTRSAAAQAKLEYLSGILSRYAPDKILELYARQIDEAELRMLNVMRLNHAAAVNRLEKAFSAIRTLNPQRQLERGYAIVFDSKGNTVTSSKQPQGRELQVRFADGSLRVKSL